MEALSWQWIIIAAISIVSIIIAYKSYEINKTRLDLSKIETDKTNPKGFAYLIDSFRYTLDRESKICVFCVKIENNSILDNSIICAELRISIVKDNQKINFVFLHNEKMGTFGEFNFENVLVLPKNIPARGALNANFLFEIPGSVLRNAEFQKHKLRIIYAEGIEGNLESNILQEVFDVKILKEKRKNGIPI